jgi:hypothetical protein
VWTSHSVPPRRPGRCGWRRRQCRVDLLGDGEAPVGRRQDALRRVAESTWRIQNRRPAITVLTFARTTGGPAERCLVELQLSAFARSGLRPSQGFSSVGDTALGLCAYFASLNSLDPEDRAKDDATWARIYAHLPEGEYPATRTHADELSRADPKAIYDTAIEAIITATERAADDGPSAAG